MPDFSRFSAFARKVGAAAPACNTCNTAAPDPVLQVSFCENSDVTPVTPVTPQNSVAGHESRLRELVDQVFSDYSALDDPMNPDAWL